MTVNLTVTISLSTTEDRGVIERALRWRIRDLIMDETELPHPDEPGYTLAIIEGVEVRVG